MLYEVITHQTRSDKIIEIARHRPTKHAEDYRSAEVANQQQDYERRSPDNRSTEGGNDGGHRHDAAPEHRSLDAGNGKGKATNAALHNPDNDGAFDSCPGHGSETVEEHLLVIVGKRQEIENPSYNFV